MAGFSGRSAILNAFALEDVSCECCYFQYTSSSSGGSNKPLLANVGSTGANVLTLSGTGAATQLTRTSTGAIPLWEGDVSPASRYLSKLMFSTPVAGRIAPATVWLVDMLLYYGSCSTSAATSLTNSVGLPRYTDGVGVMGIVCVQGALSTAAGTGNELRINYTDDTNNAQTSYMLNSNLATATQPSMLYSAVNASQGVLTGCPFIELPAGKKGIKSISSYAINANSTTGSVALMLVKPLAMMAVPGNTEAVEKDFLGRIFNPVKIEDGACLGLIVLPGGSTASTGFQVGLEYVWG